MKLNNEANILGKSYLVAGITAMILIFSGCANKQMKSVQSGFLDDYSQLKVSQLEGDEQTLLFISPDSNLDSYKNILVVPVHILINNKEIKADAETGLINEMSDYLTEKVRERISQNPDYTLVTQADKNTLKLEFAITAVKVSHDDMQIYQFLPVTLALTGATRATGIVNETTRVVMELSITDASNGKKLIRVVDMQSGKKVHARGQKITFDMVKPALDAWAKRISKRLSKLRK